jgi:hypothetical protein
MPNIITVVAIGHLRRNSQPATWRLGCGDFLPALSCLPAPDAGPAPPTLDCSTSADAEATTDEMVTGVMGSASTASSSELTIAPMMPCDMVLMGPLGIPKVSRGSR